MDGSCWLDTVVTQCVIMISNRSEEHPNISLYGFDNGAVKDV